MKVYGLRKVAIAMDNVFRSLTKEELESMKKQIEVSEEYSQYALGLFELECGVGQIYKDQIEKRIAAISDPEFDPETDLPHSLMFVGYDEAGERPTRTIMSKEEIVAIKKEMGML